MMASMSRFCMNSSMPAFISYCFMAIVAASVASAEDYPARPIRIVVGFTAGGPLDVPVRFIAERLSKSIAKSVVVKNKPGAGSMLATLDVLSQPVTATICWLVRILIPLTRFFTRRPGTRSPISSRFL